LFNQQQCFIYATASFFVEIESKENELPESDSGFADNKKNKK
jgi:hypothetical protein